MLEMCDPLIEHASDERRLADDPAPQAAPQRWTEVLGGRISCRGGAQARSPGRVQRLGRLRSLPIHGGLLPLAQPFLNEAGCGPRWQRIGEDRAGLR